ncbi:hypothetical protein NEICINOT_03483 [Neisseria cinerea ATCC 14685]|uniref:Uncharacterized protein n=1 Tax=Neisseria cinerea ATCC 14685 TaxID=546262 RepID=D0W1G4_NEICI|nr:hypothetical protein NEICINOT_03483 [Neisseria cinerea ATCC 14685]
MVYFLVFMPSEKWMMLRRHYVLCFGIGKRKHFIPSIANMWKLQIDLASLKQDV